MLHGSHVRGGAVDLHQLVSAEHANLIQLEQLADGFRVASSRRIQELAALIHLFFFGMRSSSSFHAHPSSTQADRLIGGCCGPNTPVSQKFAEVYQNYDDFWNIEYCTTMSVIIPCGGTERGRRLVHFTLEWYDKAPV